MKTIKANKTGTLNADRLAITDTPAVVADVATAQTDRREQDIRIMGKLRDEFKRLHRERAQHIANAKASAACKSSVIETTTRAGFKRTDVSSVKWAEVYPDKTQAKAAREVCARYAIFEAMEGLASILDGNASLRMF